DSKTKNQEGLSGALVLANREKEISSFHRRTSQARGSWGGYSGAATSNSGSAASAGRRAASSANLGSRRELPGARQELSS
ncbi:MAG: DUF2786 domain-containing protein, partial [Candidatus Nanopelagicales bacterium]